MTGDRTLRTDGLSNFWTDHMTSRTLTIIALAVLAACQPAPPAAETSLAGSTTSTTSAPLEPVVLTYQYVPGSALSYSVGVSQDIAFDASGDAQGFGDAELPIDADLVTESTGTATYTIDPKNQSSPFEIHITAQFPDTRVAGTVNSETVDNLEEGGVEADLARIEPVDTTVIVDAFGRILRRDDPGDELPGTDLAALTGLASHLFRVPIGPEFERNRAVTVGDRWEVETTRDGQQGPVSSRSASEVLEVTADRFVIETSTVTEAYTVDFSEQFRSLFLGLAELEGEGEIPPEVLDELLATTFLISVEEATTVEVAHFDATRGVVESSTKTGGVRLRMEFRAPEDGGDLTGFEISLDIAQTAVFTLSE